MTQIAACKYRRSVALAPMYIATTIGIMMIQSNNHQNMNLIPLTNNIIPNPLITITTRH